METALRREPAERQTPSERFFYLDQTCHRWTLDPKRTRFQSPSGRFFYLDVKTRSIGIQPMQEFQSPSGRFFYLDAEQQRLEAQRNKEFQSPSGRFFYLDPFPTASRATSTGVSIAFRAILLFRRPARSPAGRSSRSTAFQSPSGRFFYLDHGRYRLVGTLGGIDRVSIAFRAILLFRRLWYMKAGTKTTSISFQSPSGRFFYLDGRVHRLRRHRSGVSIAFRAILLFRHGRFLSLGHAPCEFQSPSGRFFYLDRRRGGRPPRAARPFQSPSGRFFYLDSRGIATPPQPRLSSVSIAFRAILLFRQKVLIVVEIVLAI